MLFPANEGEELKQAKNHFRLLGNPEREDVWSSESKERLKMKDFNAIFAEISEEEKQGFGNNLKSRLLDVSPV